MKSYRRGLGLVSFGETIYAIGGLSDDVCYNTVERYDVVMDTWTCVGTLIIPRGGVSAAVFDVGIYYIITLIHFMNHLLIFFFSETYIRCWWQ